MKLKRYYGRSPVKGLLKIDALEHFLRVICNQQAILIDTIEKLNKDPSIDYEIEKHYLLYGKPSIEIIKDEK